MNKKNIAFILSAFIALFFSEQSFAKEYAYQGQVKGMVCSFCVYNVTKKIGLIPGVIKPTVSVNLKSGHIEFLATMPIEKQQVASVFKETGFKLMKLNRTEHINSSPLKFNTQPQFAIQFSLKKMDEIEPVLDAIGKLAEAHTSLLSVKAPLSKEMEILQPLIGGRQKEIKINYLPGDKNEIEVKLFYLQTISGKKS